LNGAGKGDVRRQTVKPTVETTSTEQAVEGLLDGLEASVEWAEVLEAAQQRDLAWLSGGEQE
jgi:hypothetical protein